MKHEVPWNKEVLDKFIEYGKLNEEQRKIMRLRVKNHTDYEIASEMNFSVATYYRRVDELKRIYDKIQKEHKELPKRELLNSRLFEFLEYKNIKEFIDHIDFEEYKLELRIIRKH